jgi:hypothetical protein
VAVAEHTHTLHKKSGGTEVFARIKIEVSRGVDGFEFSAEAAHPVPKEFAEAAASGASWAFRNSSVADLSVRCLEIAWDESTTPNGVAYAMCHAVWNALGVNGYLELPLNRPALTLGSDA